MIFRKELTTRAYRVNYLHRQGLSIHLQAPDDALDHTDDLIAHHQHRQGAGHRRVNEADVVHQVGPRERSRGQGDAGLDSRLLINNLGVAAAPG